MSDCFIPSARHTANEPSSTSSDGLWLRYGLQKRYLHAHRVPACCHGPLLTQPELWRSPLGAPS